MKYYKVELIAETHFVVGEEDSAYWITGRSVYFSNFRDKRSSIVSKANFDRKSLKTRISEISKEEFLQKLEECITAIKEEVCHK